MTDNLYNDKEFQEGVKCCLEGLQNYEEFAKSVPDAEPLAVKGIQYTVNLIKHFYDSITEPEPEYVNPFECDCERCKPLESEVSGISAHPDYEGAEY